MNLSDQDIAYIAALVDTEVGQRPGLPYSEYVAMVEAIVDTVTNRTQSTAFPNSITGVINQPSQFSAINGPLANNNPHVFGSIQEAPKARPETLAIVEEHLEARALGKPSTIGSNLHYANPHKASAKSMKGWIGPMMEQGAKTLGVGSYQHAHGTDPNMVGAKPGAYEVVAGRFGPQEFQSPVHDMYTPAIDDSMLATPGAVFDTSLNANIGTPQFQADYQPPAVATQPEVSPVAQAPALGYPAHQADDFMAAAFSAPQAPQAPAFGAEPNKPSMTPEVYSGVDPTGISDLTNPSFSAPFSEFENAWNSTAPQAPAQLAAPSMPSVAQTNPHSNFAAPGGLPTPGAFGPVVEAPALGYPAYQADDFMAAAPQAPAAPAPNIANSGNILGPMMEDPDFGQPMGINPSQAMFGAPQTSTAATTSQYNSNAIDPPANIQAPSIEAPSFEAPQGLAPGTIQNFDEHGNLSLGQPAERPGSALGQLAGAFGENLANNGTFSIGGLLGALAGGAFGGPIGAMAGNQLGQQVGGFFSGNDTGFSFGGAPSGQPGFGGFSHGGFFSGFNPASGFVGYSQHADPYGFGGGGYDPTPT